MGVTHDRARAQRRREVTEIVSVQSFVQDEGSQRSVKRSKASPQVNDTILMCDTSSRKERYEDPSGVGNVTMKLEEMNVNSWKQKQRQLFLADDSALEGHVPNF